MSVPVATAPISFVVPGGGVAVVPVPCPRSAFVHRVVVQDAAAGGGNIDVVPFAHPDAAAAAADSAPVTVPAGHPMAGTWPAGAFQIGPKFSGTGGKAAYFAESSGPSLGFPGPDPGNPLDAYVYLRVTATAGRTLVASLTHLDPMKAAA